MYLAGGWHPEQEPEIEVCAAFGLRRAAARTVLAAILALGCVASVAVLGIDPPVPPEAQASR